MSAENEGGLKEKALKEAANVATGQVVKRCVEATILAGTGNPVLAKSGGKVASVAYTVAPNEIKAGAGVGAAIAANGLVHTMSVATGPAALSAALSLFPPLVIGGAIIGGIIWIRRNWS